MNREDIIRMAREAGFIVSETSRKYQPKCIDFTHYLVDDLLERFAAIVAAAEREACAKECEHTAVRMGSEWMAHHCAEAIRARSNT